MKELIYCVSTILYIIICTVIFITLIMHVAKPKTSRYFKITRNMCIAACISALIACFSLKSISLGMLIYPLPISLSNSILYNKDMIRSKECERVEEEFLKTQPIDVEYKELK